MNLRTIAIDDEPIALEKLRQYIDKTPFLTLVGAYCSPLDAMPAVMGGEVDLIFTDINMPDVNGMEFIKSMTRPPMTVFISAYPEYAVESYRVAAVDYLLKPYGLTDFQRAALKALEHFKAQHRGADAAQAPKSQYRETEAALPPKSLFVKVDYKYVRVDFDSICYIKGYGEYLQIYVHDRQMPLVTLSSFAAVLQQLPGHFMQVHRSYIVNIERIDRVERNRIVFAEDTYIPIGSTYKDAFDAHLQRRSVGGK